SENPVVPYAPLVLPGAQRPSIYTCCPRAGIDSHIGKATDQAVQLNTRFPSLFRRRSFILYRRCWQC
ncbi:hypothetical protein GBAR_LOCUS1773, partial [Geodia barretti]